MKAQFQPTSLQACLRMALACGLLLSVLQPLFLDDLRLSGLKLLVSLCQLAALLPQILDGGVFRLLQALNDYANQGISRSGWRCNKSLNSTRVSSNSISGVRARTLAVLHSSWLNRLISPSSAPC